MAELLREIGFNPERFEKNIIDVVHLDTLLRIINRQKSADLATFNDAKRILGYFDRLREHHVDIPLRFIENPAHFDAPRDPTRPIIVGGAFDGQCIKDYQESARKAGFRVTVDPWLTVRLD